LCQRPDEKVGKETKEGFGWRGGVVGKEKQKEWGGVYLFK